MFKGIPAQLGLYNIREHIYRKNIMNIIYFKTGLYTAITTHVIKMETKYRNENQFFVQ